MNKVKLAGMVVIGMVILFSVGISKGASLGAKAENKIPKAEKMAEKIGIIQLKGQLSEKLEGEYDLVAEIFTDQVRTELLSSKEFKSVGVKEGYYELPLNIEEFGLSIGTEYWLKVNVIGADIPETIAQLEILPSQIVEPSTGDSAPVITAQYDLQGNYPAPGFVARVKNLNNGFGVWAESTGGTAVYALTSGTGTAVLAENPAGTAISALGDVAVTGDLNVAGQTNLTSGDLTLGGKLTVSGTGDSSFAGKVGIGDTTPGAKFTVGPNSEFRVTATGEIRTVNGTALVPAYSFVADSNSGLIRSAEDTLGLVTGGTQRVTVNQDGHVTMEKNLNVLGITTLTNVNLPANSVTTSHIVDGTITNADISPTANIAAGKIDRVGLDADLLDGKDSAQFLTNTADIQTSGNLKIDGIGTSYISGNFGIGTQTPQELLDVAGNVTAQGKIFSEGYELLNQTKADALYVNVIADTMTGDLAVNGTISSTTEISVGGTTLSPAGATIGGDLSVTGAIHNENVIHFDVAGTERWAMTGMRLEPKNLIDSVFVGENAGLSSTETLVDCINDPKSYPCRSTFIGYEAGLSTTYDPDCLPLPNGRGYPTYCTGTSNTFVGYQSGRENTLGMFNSYFGALAGHQGNQVGALYNSFFGHEAGYNNQSSKGSFFGEKAGYSNTLGEKNSIFGQEAGFENTTGHWNSFFGSETGRFVDCIDGPSCGANSFFGAQAGRGCEYIPGAPDCIKATGGYNSFFGFRAGLKNSRGSYNSYFGQTAGSNHEVGDYNTFVGASAGWRSQGGSDNTYVGGNAGPNPENSLENATVLGAHTSVGASNQVRIGNTNVDSIGGPVNWTSFSDGRYETRVQEDVKGLDFIMRLRPVTYNMEMSALNKALRPYGEEGVDEETNARRQATAEAKGRIRYSGFVAQEVEEAARALDYDFSGVDAPKNEKGFYGLRYAEFVVPLVKAMQEQQDAMAVQDEKLKRLEEENETLKAQMKAIQWQLGIAATGGKVETLARGMTGGKR